MGIYDRDYYRSERPGIYLTAPRTIVAYLILINAAVWLANAVFTPPDPPSDLGTISDLLALHTQSLTRPWLWWQFLTYGFVHAPEFGHILSNMLGLFFLGRAVESIYGPKEFLRIYCVALVAGSVVWAIVNRLMGTEGVLLGASGAVVAVVILFAVNFPRQTVLFMFFLPMPAWVLGVLLVAFDLHGAIFRPYTQVAYLVHLTGTAFALAYYRFHWNFGRWIPSGLSSVRFRPKPRLRVHDPQHERSQLNEEVDRILEKITREGEESLSRKERRTLETASRQFQKRRQDGGD